MWRTGFLLRGMWDLLGPWLEPMFLALAGGFLTTVPSGKSRPSLFLDQFIQRFITYIDHFNEPPFVFIDFFLLLVYIPVQELANSFCKGPDSRYFRFYGPYMVTVLYSLFYRCLFYSLLKMKNDSKFKGYIEIGH